MPRIYEESAVAGFDPATRECRFVGRRHPEDVIEALDLGLVLVPVTVEQAREVFGQPMDRLMSLPRAGRIYLAGPMTGIEDFNYPAFHAEAERLRELGYHVENPADHGMIDGYEWADYLRLDLQKLITCEAIALLPGWDKSKGARLEYHVATELGMQVHTASQITEPARSAA